MEIAPVKHYKTQKCQRDAVNNYIEKRKISSPDEYKQMRRESNRKYYDKLRKARELVALLHLKLQNTI